MPGARTDGGEIILTDGALCFDGGVSSMKTTTIASPLNPNGLQRNELAWMDNCTVREGGIGQRPAWWKKGTLPVMGTYMGSETYLPDNGLPYDLVVVSGEVWKVDPDDPGAAVNLSAQFGLTLPLTERAFFAQAEQFLVIQCGDDTALPLIWDGSLLRTSLGLDGMGFVLPTSNIGSVAFHYTDANWVVPPLLGPSVTLQTTDPVTIGQHVFGLYFVSYNSSTGQIISTQGIAASFLITGANPGVSVNIQLIGYGPRFTPGTVVGGPSVLFKLTHEPTVFMPGTAEIPPATAMCYYMGRLWYARANILSAGDIVGNQSSGTQAYNFRDSVLKVTENPLCVGGDGFAVPSSTANIRGIAYAANINTQLGEGQLYFGTREEIYAITVPVTRTDWINANTNNQPLITVVQSGNGWVNDRSIVQVNGDLFFQSLEPSIRSLSAAVRNFQQWGNVPISVEEFRALQYTDRSLMRFASGIYFDNRLLQTILPFQTPAGVAFKAIAALNFDVVSTLKQQLPPAWEGMWEAMPTLELKTEDFGGLQRSFAYVWSEANQAIELWEITTSERFDKNENRILSYIETPAFTFGRELELKELVSAELWIDRLVGETMFTVEYRPDSSDCWYPWLTFKVCTTGGPVPTYPVTPKPGQSYRQTITLPKPPVDCAPAMGRPSTIGYQFQMRVSWKGSTRIRGYFLHAQPVVRRLYDSLPEIC